MTIAPTIPPLTLDPVSGPPLKAILVRPEDAASPVAIGRSTGSPVQLSDPDAAVSRTHAELSIDAKSPDPWHLTDATSRHGTYVNGTRLEPGSPAPLRDGDQVRIGPWVLRVRLGETPPASRRMTPTNDDRRFTASMMHAVAGAAIEKNAQKRLELLMRAAGAIGNARTEAAVAEAAVEALAQGTGLPRCAVLRTDANADEAEVLASRGVVDGRFSRSLILAAADPANQGRAVVLAPGMVHSGREFGQSIVTLEITAAVCAAVEVQRLPDRGPDGAGGARLRTAPATAPERVIDAMLYADARSGAKAAIADDVAAFCQTLAGMVGLALSNLHRAGVEAEEHRRRGELETARAVQRIIMPLPSGRVAPAGCMPASYYMVSMPGRFVAGDLFDFFPVGDRRCGMLLGDVVGKGVAAGMVMANVQAHLSRLLRQTGDPAATLTEVNRLVSAYSDRFSAEGGRAGLFVSLFAGVFDLALGTLTYADAGHGFAFLRARGGAIERPFMLGGAPLGVTNDIAYESSDIKIAAGARLFVFSDGVVEQRNPSGDEFGVDRALLALKAEAAPGEEVGSLIGALRDHAALGEGASYADDVTVVSIAVG